MIEVDVLNGHDFNQPIILPEGLQQVRFRDNYNQRVVLTEGFVLR